MATEEPEAVSRERMSDKADIRGQSIQARLRLEIGEVEKSTLIREWQDTTTEQPSVGSSGVVSRLFDGCINLLRSIVNCSKGKDGSHGDCMQLQESLLALILWSEDHHLSTGNLDTQLHDSEDLRELICSLLLSLADLLVNGLLQQIVTSPAERHATIFKYNMLSLMHEARKEIGIVETPVDYTHDNVSNMAATLATLADCLISLNPSLGQSAKDDYNQHSGHYTVIEDRPPYLYHVELIRSKFANASPSLLERLGKCNWKRYLILKERRETIKDGEHLQSDEMESKSKFYDSALGTSVPAQSELGGSISAYAETVVSSRAASSHQKLPKLPSEGRKGKRFICQICNKVVAIRYSRDWKKHVFQDLLAYTCIYEGCSISSINLWEDRDAMTNHLALEHGLDPEWKGHPCPLCTHHTGEGKDLISLHISRHMEEIALNALPSGYESDSESEANSAVTDSQSTSSKKDDSPFPKTFNFLKPENVPEPDDDISEFAAPVPYDPAQHSISESQAFSFSSWPALNSGVDPAADEQLNAKYPIPSIGGIFSPNTEPSDWNALYQNRQSANVSPTLPFQDSFESPFRHGIQTSQPAVFSDQLELRRPAVAEVKSPKPKWAPTEATRQDAPPRRKTFWDTIANDTGPLNADKNPLARIRQILNPANYPRRADSPTGTTPPGTPDNRLSERPEMAPPVSRASVSVSNDVASSRQLSGAASVVSQLPGTQPLLALPVEAPKRSNSRDKSLEQRQNRWRAAVPPQNGPTPPLRPPQNAFLKHQGWTVESQMRLSQQPAASAQSYPNFAPPYDALAQPPTGYGPPGPPPYQSIYAPPPSQEGYSPPAPYSTPPLPSGAGLPPPPPPHEQPQNYGRQYGGRPILPATIDQRSNGGASEGQASKSPAQNSPASSQEQSHYGSSAVGGHSEGGGRGGRRRWKNTAPGTEFRPYTGPKRH